MTESTLDPRDYTDVVLRELGRDVLDRITRIAESGARLPEPTVLVDLLQANLPDVPDDLDPHYADLGPFYASDGAIRQLGGVTKQALDSRRRHESVLALRTGDGTWLYPAWQFTGAGGVHPVLAPVLKALRGLDRWAAGVWLVAEHPDLDGVSPRAALSAGVDPMVVAGLAEHDVVHAAA